MVAPVALTTAGIPNSLAKIAPWLVNPPCSVIMPAIPCSKGKQSGVITDAMRITPLGTCIGFCDELRI